MPRQNSPTEGLQRWSDRKDSDMTPGSVSFRMPMWLFRMALRGGRLLKLDDVAQSFRACIYLGAEKLLAGEVPQMTDDITSAAKGSPTRGSGPLRRSGKGQAPVTTEEVIQAAPEEKLREELLRRSPSLVICDRDELVAKFSEWQRRQLEGLRGESLGL